VLPANKKKIERKKKKRGSIRGSPWEANKAENDSPHESTESAEDSTKTRNDRRGWGGKRRLKAHNWR